MRALMLTGPSRFEVVDLPVPDPGPDEVRIRVRACGICGSDVHGMDGSTGRRIPPIVMGHEAAGEIEAVGAGVGDWSPGDRVTFDSTVYCGECAACRAGRVNLCDARQVLGVSCAEYRRQGAFAESVVVPARILHRLPDGLTFEEAAMAEPVSVALHAVHRANLQPGSRVAVIGTGMIGLLVVQALKALGAGEVVAVDLDPAKRALALDLGADREAASAAGLELDAAFEVVGIGPTVEMAVASVRKGGTVVLVGNLAPRVELPLQAVVTRELTLYGSCASQGDYPESLALLASGAIRGDRLLSETVPLEDAASAFSRLARGEPGLMKVMVRP